MLTNVDLTLIKEIIPSIIINLNLEYTKILFYVSVDEKTFNRT